MNLNRRIVSLEKKATPAHLKSVHVVDVKDNETEDQAIERYCKTKNIDKIELDNSPLPTIILIHKLGCKQDND